MRILLIEDEPALAENLEADHHIVEWFTTLDEADSALRDRHMRTPVAISRAHVQRLKARLVIPPPKARCTAAWTPMHLAAYWAICLITRSNTLTDR